MTWRPILLLALLGTAAPVSAQDAPAPAPPPASAAQSAAEADPLVVDIEGGISSPMTVAVPPMPTPRSAPTPAGETGALGVRVADVVAGDLRASGLFRPSGPAGLRAIGYGEVAAPSYGGWSPAQALVQGYVEANADGTLTIGCNLFDLFARAQLASERFTVQPADWRRGAHRCADAVYGRLTGEDPYFDSRVLYVAETGPKDRRVKRLALMDADGAGHRFLTNGQTTVLTPRLSPDQRSVVYMSYVGKTPRVYLLTVGTGEQRPLIETPNMTFAPRFSPDGRSVVFSMAVAGNTDIYRVPVAGGPPERLTTAPGIDTGGSYSPDGRRIVFESDRGGSQQLYVMNADGTDQGRISFGGGGYATPVWSPRGDRIAFTKIGGGRFRIGVMTPAGRDEKLLTESWHDEGPSWAPNGRAIIFFRSAQGASGDARLWSVDLTGVNERRIATPLDGSDPSWSPILP